MSGSVLDVGCGYGRLSDAFDDYVGVDISDRSLNEARKRNPHKKFQRYDLPLPKTDWQLYYAVLIHVPDDVIADYLADNLVSTQNVMIGDVMNTKWRKPNTRPYTFHRTADEYRELLGRDMTEDTFPLKSYPGEVLTLLRTCETP